MGNGGEETEAGKFLRRGFERRRRRDVEEADQGAGAVGLLQLADGLGFDLADAFAGDGEDLADFFQRVGVAVGQAVAQAEDFPLAVVEVVPARRRSGA